MYCWVSVESFSAPKAAGQPGGGEGVGSTRTAAAYHRHRGYGFGLHSVASRCRHRRVGRDRTVHRYRVAEPPAHRLELRDARPHADGSPTPSRSGSRISHHREGYTRSRPRQGRRSGTFPITLTRVQTSFSLRTHICSYIAHDVLSTPAASLAKRPAPNFPSRRANPRPST